MLRVARDPEPDAGACMTYRVGAVATAAVGCAAAVLGAVATAGTAGSWRSFIGGAPGRTRGPRRGCAVCYALLLCRFSSALDVRGVVPRYRELRDFRTAPRA